MNFNTIDDLESNGFEGFKTMKELFLDDACIPKLKGVYIILHVDKTPEFLITGCGPTLYKKKINPNVSINELKVNWVKNTPVIYIGQTGTTLKKRLKAYFSFGQGKDVGHYGGRYIWQLKNAEKLVVCWKTNLTKEPKEAENSLIQEFKSQFMQRPFANLKY